MFHSFIRPGRVSFAESHNIANNSATSTPIHGAGPANFSMSHGLFSGMVARYAPWVADIEVQFVPFAAGRLHQPAVPAPGARNRRARPRHHGPRQCPLPP